MMTGAGTLVIPQSFKKNQISKWIVTLNVIGIRLGWYAIGGHIMMIGRMRMATIACGEFIRLC